MHACENDRGAPGSGNVTWNEVAAGLKDIGYDGPVVIESFTAKVKSIARAAAIWRSLAPTQDDLARDGLEQPRHHLLTLGGGAGTIGISGIDRLVRHNVLATSGHDLTVR